MPGFRVRADSGGHPPGVAGWLLVVLCGVTGLYCLVLRHRCPGAGSEAVMGLGMAAMGLPASVFTPPAWWWAGYAVVFGAEAARSAWALRGGGARGRHAHHLIGSLAMVYMALPTGAAAQAEPGTHGAHGAGGVPLLTGALLAYYAVWTLRAGARLVPAPALPTTLPAATALAAPTPARPPAMPTAPSVPAAAPFAPPPSPAAAGVAACRVAMAVAMLVMLAGGHAVPGAR
ncbi:hypothetical protein SUDANB25_00495 [Streptomyces sp. SudanB25_2051]